MIYQGQVAIDGSTRILCTVDTSIINFISVTNTEGAYTFGLKRYRSKGVINTVTLYELELESGDVVKDTYEYYLYKGDYLQLLSDVEGTNYYIKSTP